MELPWKVKEDTRVSLKDFDADYVEKGLSRADGEKELAEITAEINDLQESLAAAQHQSMLIILQGMDTSGKDGTTRHVFSSMNPQGCDVHSFKAPTAEELAHDFLWRVHKVVPAKGVVGIFNRSQYEDVLIVRVHNLVPEEVWSRRYKEINNFEKLLARNGTIILKFFLHISYDEQEKRLLARQQDPDKAWKVDADDWTERQYWDAYQAAYADALSKCSTEEAPWYIVPANTKWYRSLLVARTVLHTMKQYEDEWKEELQARGKRELARLQQTQNAQQ